MPVVNVESSEQIEREKSQPAVDGDIYVYKFDLSGETITASTTNVYEFDFPVDSYSVSFSHNIDNVDVDVEYDGKINSSGHVEATISETGGGDVTLGSEAEANIIVYDY